MSTVGIIYMARNKKTSRAYVGQTTKGLKIRMKQHLQKN